MPRKSFLERVLLTEPVQHKGEEAGKAEGRVDVTLEDVEGEVVKTAEGPDGEADK